MSTPNCRVLCKLWQLSKRTPTARVDGFFWARVGEQPFLFLFVCRGSENERVVLYMYGFICIGIDMYTYTYFWQWFGLQFTHIYLIKHISLYLHLYIHIEGMSHDLLGQWLFLVPLIGGRWYIITQLAVYTTYIPLICCQLGDYMLPTTYYGNQETPLILILFWSFLFKRKLSLKQRPGGVVHQCRNVSSDMFFGVALNGLNIYLLYKKGPHRWVTGVITLLIIGCFWGRVNGLNLHEGLITCLNCLNCRYCHDESWKKQAAWEFFRLWS